MNTQKLFVTSCLSIGTAAAVFAIRGDVAGPMRAAFQITNEQMGLIFSPAFWAFTIAIFISGNLVDVIAGRNASVTGPTDVRGRESGSFGGAVTALAGALGPGTLTIGNSVKASGGGCARAGAPGTMQTPRRRTSSGRGSPPRGEALPSRREST